MAPSTEFAKTANVGPAVAARNGGKTATISGTHGQLSFVLPEPQRVPFEPQGWNGAEDRVSLCVELDAATLEWLKVVDEALMEKAAAELQLDARDYVSFLKETKYGTTLLKTKWQRDGRYAANIWNTDQQLRQAPDEWIDYRIRIRVNVGSVYIQNRSWGISLSCSDIEVHEPQTAEAACPFG